LETFGKKLSREVTKDLRDEFTCLNVDGPVEDIVEIDPGAKASAVNGRRRTVEKVV